MYEYFFETKFIQGCRPVSFHCFLRLLALLLHSKTRCWQHWRHATVARQIWELLEMWLTFQQARHIHVVWALMRFLPLYWQTFMPRQVLRPQQPKISTAVKGKWVISWGSFISISVPENSVADWQNQFTPEWEVWAWSRLSAASLPGRGGGSRWAANSCCQRQIHQGWCQDLAKERHVSCKTTSLIRKAVSRFQHANCQRRLGLVLRTRKVNVLHLLGWDGNGKALSIA